MNLTLLAYPRHVYFQYSDDQYLYMVQQSHMTFFERADSIHKRIQIALEVIDKKTSTLIKHRLAHVPREIFK